MQRAGEQLAAFGEDRLRRWAPWLIIALALAVLLPGSNTLPLMDRDEPRFAQATREMMERGEWIVPYFNGEYRLHKPILIYWLMRGTYAALGVNELAARLPAIICSALTGLLLFHVGRQWFSAATGFVAAFALLTCAQMLLVGRGALADMPLVLCALAAQYALFELLQAETNRSRWFWLFYGAMGVGFLAKGPVALALPVLTLLFYRFAFWRKPVAWRRLRIELGLPVTLAIIASWGVPALLRTHGEFWRVGIGEHVVHRGLATFEGHGSFAPYYYFLTALFSLFPWICFAGNTINATRRFWNDRNAFLVSWIAGTYLLFTLYLTKLPHYVLPAFPALMLLLGQSAYPEIKTGRWARVWFWTVFLAAILAGAAPPILLRAGIIGAVGLIISFLPLMLIWWRGRLVWSWLPVVLLAVSTALLGFTIRMVSPVPRVRELARTLPEETQCASFGFSEPSLVFYTNRRWEELHSEQEAESFLAAPGSRLLVYERSEFRADDVVKKKAAAQHPDPAISDPSIRSLDIEGLNVARGSWVKLRVYYRDRLRFQRSCSG